MRVFPFVATSGVVDQSFVPRTSGVSVSAHSHSHASG